MANVKISDLAPAQLPLDLPNTLFEVQTFEAGIPVSRKITGDDLTVQGEITIEDEGTPLTGGADTLNFTGAGVTASGSGTTKTINIPGGGGGGSPGGADTQVQYNNAGAFGGDPEFTWDNTNFVLEINGSQARILIDETDGGGDSRVQLTSTTTADGGAALLFDSTTGRLALQQTDDAGNLEDLWINMQRNGAVQIYDDGTQVARTDAPGAGGLFVNNLSTGAGFERVLTTSDAGGGSLPSGVVGDTIYISTAPDTYSASSTLQVIPGTGILVNDDEIRVLNATGTSSLFLEVTVGSDVGEIRVDTGGNMRFEVNGNVHLNLGNGILTQIYHPSGSTSRPVFQTEQAGFQLQSSSAAGSAIFGISTASATQSSIITFEGPDDGARVLYQQSNNTFLIQQASQFGGSPVQSWIECTRDDDVALFDAGVEVARTIPAASGGFEVNNQSTGAGFERVLTTSDLGGGASPGGPANSIQYNSGGSFGGDANFTWTALSGELELTHPAGPGSGRPAFQINQNAANSEVFIIDTNQAGPGNVIMELNPNSGTAGFRLETDWSGADNTHHVRWVNDLGQERLLLQYDGLSRIGGVLFDLPNSTLEFGTYVLEFTEQASGNPSAATIGQLWVRNDTPNVLIFTDDAGTDFVLNGGGGGGVNSVTAGTNLNDTGTAADPILNVDDPLIIGSINATSALNDTTVGSPYANVPLNIGANLVGTQGMTQYSRQRIQARPSSFGYNSTLFINIQGEPGTNGANTFIGGLNSAGIEVDFGVEVNLRHGVAPGNSAPVMSTFTRGIKLPQGSIYVTQTGTPGANDTNSGQFWVRNDTVQKPMFTDDAGRDHNLIAEFDEQTSDTTVNNSTTLVNTQIDFSDIPTGHYRIDMLVLLRDVAVTGCGARVQISLSGTDPDSVMRVVNKNFSGAGTPSYDEVGLVGDLFDNMPLVTGSGTSRFMFSGIIEFISGTNSFTVQFAQNTALVGDLDFESGSWCSLTRVGP